VLITSTSRFKSVQSHNNVDNGWLAIDGVTVSAVISAVLTSVILPLVVKMYAKIARIEERQNWILRELNELKKRIERV